jgi:hypothetical protein
MKILKPLAIAAALVATLTGAAHACDPHQVGDRYESNGGIYEVVKVNSATCYVKLCVRPVGSKQNCRWIKEPMDGVTWIIEWGVKQQ